MPSHHSICGAAVACVTAVSALAAAQPPPARSDQAAASFTIFIRGVPLGTEQISVVRTADGWTISSSGRLGAPLDIVARRIQVRYTPDWHPLEFTLDGTSKGQVQRIHTVVEGTTATTETTAAGQTTKKSDTVDPAALLLLAEQLLFNVRSARRPGRGGGARDDCCPRT